MPQILPIFYVITEWLGWEKPLRSLSPAVNPAIQTNTTAKSARVVAAVHVLPVASSGQEAGNTD